MRNGTRSKAIPAAFLFVFAGVAAATSAASLAADTWSPTGAMATARQSFTLTPLPSGEVLVTGGFSGNETVELYDPSSATWSFGPSMSTFRDNHTATLLSDGRVLVAGGPFLDTAEIYDPVTGTWSPTGSMADIREGHTATLLSDGRVLVAGGFTRSARLATAELYDPATGTWSLTGSMAGIRQKHTATLLPDGRVLVAGGTSGSRLRSAELYDPATGTWSETGSMTNDHASHTATLLPNGHVLVAGDGAPRAELYDPSTGTWRLTGPMSEIRRDHTSTLRPDGTVLVAGGSGELFNALASAELYDPATGTWSSAGSMANVRYGHAATLLPDGTVLVAGGGLFGGGGSTATAELFGEGPGPGVFHVDSTADGVDTDPGDGACVDTADAACTLRAAVMEANALPGADIIVLPAGTYSLGLAGAGENEAATGDLDVADALTIRGAGAEHSIIDGGGHDRVFHILTGQTVQISGVTVQNGLTGESGGGIFNKGILTVFDSAIRGNLAGGSGGGGGVYNDGDLTLMAVTLTGNRAGKGGGITNNAAMAVLNSTFSGNAAIALSSTRSHLSEGGAVFNEPFSGTIAMSHSTIANNAAEDEGGGIFVDCDGHSCGLWDLGHSIVAGNQAPTSPDCAFNIQPEVYGLRSAGFNLVGNGDGCQFVRATGDLVGSTASPIDPMLGVLADYGGPTETHALLAGSPAIDHVPRSVCDATSDQRGVGRPQGQACDIGAYEAATCTLEMAADFADGVLELDVVLGLRAPGQWSGLLLTARGRRPLWSISLPVVDPPGSVPLSFEIPPLGGFGVLSFIEVAKRTVCFAVAPVETGADSATGGSLE